MLETCDNYINVLINWCKKRNVVVFFIQDSFQGTGGVTFIIALPQ